jgi:hypothetical protein
MAADTLWPVVVGGLLTLGGTVAGVIGTAIRDMTQQRHEKTKRRADKFEELVAAVYEFEHWLDGVKDKNAYGKDVPETVSPFAKVQSIAAVYFPQFSEMVGELDKASTLYRGWIHGAAQKRVRNDLDHMNDGFVEAYTPLCEKQEALLRALQQFAREHFQ